MTGKTDYRYFVGLPSPAGALTIASIVNYAPAPVTDAASRIVMLDRHRSSSRSRWSRRSDSARQKGLALQKERSLMYFLVFALILAVGDASGRSEFCFVGAIALSPLRSAGAALVDRVPAAAASSR